jgi:hypothetical protein
VNLKKKSNSAVLCSLERLNVADCYIALKNGRDFFRDERVQNILKYLVMDDQLFSYKEVRENLNGLRRLDVFI